VEVVPSYSESDGDIGVSLVGRKTLGKSKNTEVKVSFKSAVGEKTEGSWYLEHKTTRRLRFSIGCDHGDRQATGTSSGEAPGPVQTFREFGDCSADAKFRFEFR
jgi:hypothetical protein